MIAAFRSRDLDHNPIVSADYSFAARPALKKNLRLQKSCSTKSKSGSLCGTIDDLVDLKQLVDDFDNGGKGGLDEDEFVSALGSKWTGYTPELLSRLFMQIDANSDGTITYEELVTFLLLKEQDSVQKRTPSKYLHKPSCTGHAEGASSNISHVCFLPSRDRYVSLTAMGHFHLWDGRGMTPVRSARDTEGKMKMASSLIYASRQNRLVVACHDGRLYFHDATSMCCDSSFRLREPAQTIANFERPVSTMVEDYVPNDRLFIGSQCGNLHVLDWHEILSGRRRFDFSAKLHDSWVEKIEWVPDLNGLLSCGADGTLLISDLGRGTCTERNRLRHPNGKGIHSLAWCSSLAAVATCGIERQILWWSPSLARPVFKLSGHTATVTEVLLDERNLQLISSSEDSVVRVWDVRTHKCVQAIEPLRGHAVSAMTLDSARNCLLTAGRQLCRYSMLVGDFDEESELTPIRAPNRNEPARKNVQVSSALVSVLGNVSFGLLISIDSGCTIRTWDLSTGNHIHSINAAQAGGEDFEDVEFTVAVLDASCRRLLTGSTDGRLRAWNLTTGQLLVTFLPPKKLLQFSSALKYVEISSIVCYRHERRSYIAAGGWSREIWIWEDDPKDGVTHVDCQQVLRGHTGDVLCISHSEPHYLVTGGYDGKILIWNLQSGSLKGKLELDKDTLSLAGLDDSALLTHKTGTHSWLRSAPVTNVLFVSKCTFISTNADGRLLAWNTSNVPCLLFELIMDRCYDANSTVSAISWNAEASTLAVGYSSGYLALWRGNDILELATETSVCLPRRRQKRLLSFQSWRVQEDPIIAIDLMKHRPSRETLVLTGAVRPDVLQLWTHNGSNVGCVGTDSWDILDATTYKRCIQDDLELSSNLSTRDGGEAFITQSADGMDQYVRGDVEDLSTQDKVVQKLKARARITLQERAKINALHSLSDELCTKTLSFLDKASAGNFKSNVRHPSLRTHEIEPLNLPILNSIVRNSKSKTSIRFTL